MNVSWEWKLSLDRLILLGLPLFPRSIWVDLVIILSLKTTDPMVEIPISYSSMGFRTSVSNYTHIKLWGIITHQCPNFNGNSAKPVLKSGYRCAIKFHWKIMLCNYSFMLYLLSVKGAQKMELSWSWYFNFREGHYLAFCRSSHYISCITIDLTLQYISLPYLIRLLHAGSIHR